MSILTPTRIYKDLDLDFGKHPQKGDVLKKTDVNSIRQSLRNLLFTIPGERPFQPYLGTELYRLMFEPMDPITISALDQTIERTIQNFEPRVELQLIQLVAAPDENSVDISIFFKVKGTGTPGSFTATLTRLR